MIKTFVGLVDNILIAHFWNSLQLDYFNYFKFISVLPKFEVKLNLSSLLTLNDDVPVGISAKYTFGKGVQGKATVLAEYPNYYSDSVKRQRPPIEKGIDVGGN